MTRNRNHDLADDSFEAGIARQFALAFVAFMTETTFQTVEKRHGHERPGTYWMDLAKQVSEDYQAGRFGSR